MSSFHYARFGIKVQLLVRPEAGLCLTTVYLNLHFKSRLIGQQPSVNASPCLRVLIASSAQRCESLNFFCTRQPPISALTTLVLPVQSYLGASFPSNPSYQLDGLLPSDPFHRKWQDYSFLKDRLSGASFHSILVTRTGGGGSFLTGYTNCR